MTKSRNLALLILFAIFGSFSQQSHAFVGTTSKVALAIVRILPSPGALPSDEIVRLSKLASEAGGTIKVGADLGRRNLPNDVLEDTFLRIAVHQSRINRPEAERMFARLTGVPGFRTTLRKIIGNSFVGTSGHLYELRIADSAVGRGLKVIGIGEKFNDGLKRAPTDIDLVLKQGKTVLAVEAKNYSPSTLMPLDRYRADLDSLVAYRKAKGKHVVAVFSVSNRPHDLNYLKMLRREADKRKVELIFGNAEESVAQIKALGDIL